MNDKTQSRIEKVLSGKTPEEQYDILYWLMMEYGKGYSNSRLARIEWLKGEKDFCSSDDYRMRKCGDGWEYCNGKCSECPKTHIVTTKHT